MLNFDTALSLSLKQVIKQYSNHFMAKGAIICGNKLLKKKSFGIQTQVRKVK